MRNIHVLPTEKPSRLKQNKITKKYSLVTKGIDLTMYTPHNIYITSDEEIKEGDWVIYQKFMFPLKVVLDQDGYHIISNGIGEIVGDYYSLQERYKKIIITTDQDLIKDGVQAIDDEFLEWFVKNPSCESIKCINTWMYYPKKWEYKIIIPKEEPKQHVEFINNNIDQLDKAIESFKQETLEEAINKEINNIYINSSNLENIAKYNRISGTLLSELKKCMTNIAKWQQEQVYSIDDLKEAFWMGRTNATIKDFNTKFKNK
jgi:hypothetical protein